jgi:PAS domain S-box-containing protein
MSQTSLTTKIYSILGNQPQVEIPETISHYSHYHTDRVTPDLLEMVWDRTQDGMLMTDSDGVIVAVNAAFCSMMKMREQELVGFPFTVMYDGRSDRKRIFETYLERVKLGSIPKKYEQEFRLNSGQTLDVEIITSTLTDDADEVFVLTEFRDISERKRWERTTFQSEIRYRSLFENAVLPMYESNIDGKLTNANIAMLNLLGYNSFAELLSLNLEKDVYVHPEQRVTLFERLQADNGGEPTELQLRKKDGSIITVLAHARILRDDQGAPLGFEGVLENITERKELERQVQQNVSKLEANREELTRLNAQKDKILAIVSHDLRSPFSSILGFCDLLKSEFASLTDAEKLEYIGFINEAAVQQLAMVNSILDWSRLETGRMNVRYTAVDLRSLVSTAATSMLGLAIKKDITIEHAVPEKTVLNGDEQLLRQLVLNLVGNALKFTPAGGTISIGLTENSDSRLVLTVTDTGMGIPASDIPKLFKIEEKYSRQGLQGESGTGLGLPMCFEIMKKHNGTIEAVSEEGRGTSFILTFHKAPRTVCKKILVVDDQTGNRMIISRFVKRIAEGSEVLFAETATEALTIMASAAPDLIVTDYHMPQMNGLEFIRTIRAEERTKNIPVILVSGANLEEHVQNDVITKVLRKPINFTELKGVMHTIQF